MLTVKDVRAFRSKYRNKKPVFRDSTSVNEHFIGTQHGELSGFFLLFHGDKEEIENFLRANFQMAEDGQAVFEFIQNAADCGSSKFWLFFNDQYFLAVNNGKTFQEAGIESILNIGQSHGKKGCDKIGRYGVGFKLVHRLVGRTDGLDEIVRQNKGPILFSWSNSSQLNAFFSFEGNSVQFSNEDGSPWLTKIILTCFPAQVNETILDLNYTEKVLFGEDELIECVNYVSKCMGHIDMEKDLNEGSLFFLKLGEGKAEIIRKETQSIENGVGISMQFLTNLSSITINQNEVSKSKICWLPACAIAPSTQEYEVLGLTDKKVLECPAVIEVGYLPFRDSGNTIRRAPNFFKFFPMGDEVNGLNFVIHSNVFDHETNRRKLHDQSTNHRILEAAARHICECAGNADTGLFLEIFANIMLSDPPEGTGNSWQRPYFYDKLIKYAKDHVPAIGLNGIALRISNETAVINNTNLEIHPKEWGIQMDWFFCHKKEEAAAELIKRVSEHEELKLKTWKIADLIRNGNNDQIIQWIEGNKTTEPEAIKIQCLIEELFEISKHEIEKNNLELFNKCSILPVFKFSDGKYYSLNEIKQNSQLLFLEENRTLGIRHILEKIGVITSINFIQKEQGTDFGASVKKFLGIEAPEELFKKIVLNLEGEILKDGLNLEEDEKCRLFEGLIQIYDDKKSIRDLKLFSNKKGNILKMREIIPHQEGKGLLTEYEINISAEQSASLKLKGFLCLQTEVFSNIIIPYWEEIIKLQKHDKIFELINQVTSWFLQAEPASKLSLGGQRIVFLDSPKEWFLGTQVFFHSSMKDIEPEKYKKSNTATIALTGKSLPDIRQIKLLSEAPFNLKNIILNELEGKQNAKLDYDDLKSFIEMCKAIGDDFFASYYVTDNQGLASVTLRTEEEVTQFYTSNDELSAIIKELTINAARLPAALSELRISNHIKRESDLQKWIIDLVKDQNKFDEYTEKLASVINTKDAAEHFFKSVPKLYISIERLEVVQCKPLPWITLIDEKFLDLNKLIDIRKKIFINFPDDTEYLLAEYTASSTFRVQEYELSFSDLFPDDKNFERCAITNQIYSNLINNYPIKEEWLKTLFGVEVEEISKERGVELLNQIPATPTNATQLIFCLLTSEWDESSNRRIIASDQKEYLFNSQWLITKREFVLTSSQLHTQYDGIENLLRLNKSNPEAQIGGCKFVFDFFFGEDNVLRYFGLNNEPNEEQSKSAFLYLYNIWKTQSTHKWKGVNIKDFSQVLGFHPFESILPDEYSIDKEVLPEYVQNLIKLSSDYVEFLVNLGVNSEASPLVKLRKFLFREDIDFNKNDLTRALIINEEIGRITEQLLYNTLLFLKGKIFCEDSLIEMVQYLFSSIPPFEGRPSFPILYIFSYEKEKPVYQILQPVEVQYRIDESFVDSLKGYQINSLQHLIDFCDERGIRIVDSRNLPLNTNWDWISSLRNIRIEPDWESIDKKSVPCDEDYYVSWRNEDEERPEIFLFDGPIPEFLFLEQIDDENFFSIVYKRDLILGLNGKIFLNRRKNLIELLHNNASYLGLTESHINRLSIILSDLRAINKSDGDNPFINISSLEDRTRAEINDEAKRQAVSWLRQKGFIVPEPPKFDYYKIKNVFDQDNTPVIVHVRSSRAGYLFISPADWQELSKSNAFLLVVLPGGKITTLTFDELIQSNTQIHLQFDPQLFTPDGLVAIAKIFQYIPSVSFVVRSTTFSASEDIKSFGLDRRLDELVKTAPTNLID